MTIAWNKQLSKLNNKKIPVRKWTDDMNGHITEKNMQMANMHMKIYLTLSFIRELQIKTSRYHYTSIRMLKIKNYKKNYDNTKF